MFTCHANTDVEEWCHRLLGGPWALWRRGEQRGLLNAAQSYRSNTKEAPRHRQQTQPQREQIDQRLELTPSAGLLAPPPCTSTLFTPASHPQQPKHTVIQMYPKYLKGPKSTQKYLKCSPKYPKVPESTRKYPEVKKQLSNSTQMCHKEPQGAHFLEIL